LIFLFGYCAAISLATVLLMPDDDSTAVGRESDGGGPTVFAVTGQQLRIGVLIRPATASSA